MSHTVFAERLGVSMNIAGLSNAHLSKILNIDPSLISRYRSGERRPKKSSDLLMPLCQTLYRYILSNKKADELSSVMNIPQTGSRRSISPTGCLILIHQRKTMLAVPKDSLRPLILFRRRRVSLSPLSMKPRPQSS